MPIVNYEYLAQNSKNNLMTNPRISGTNKDYLKKFFNAYDVSPARLNLFCKHIHFLLERSYDIKRDMADRDKINSIFSEIRNEVKPGYYNTIISVSLKFVRWLNMNEKPQGFCDIKNSKKGQKRDLKPSDMITWEEGLTMISKTNSVQFKAILMTQLDGGFRPSEFIDLNYGDIAREGKFLIAHAKGKTGTREVALFKSVPYLVKWIEQHPLKQKDSPLWLMETPQNSHRKSNDNRYQYQAIVKQIRKLGYLTHINKPLDFYNLRHSACTLAKKQNLNPELAAIKFGHSVEYFVNTYGRLSQADTIKRYEKAYGITTTEQNPKENPIECTMCNNINEPGKEYCSKCNNPLTLRKALEDAQRIDELKELMLKLFKNPEHQKIINAL